MVKPAGTQFHLRGKVAAVGLWHGSTATVLQHRGAVFHKLSQGRPGKELVLTEEETVYALMRTVFLLYDTDTLKQVTAEGILRRHLASGQYRRLLRLHVYLAVIALNKTPEPINVSEVKVIEESFACTRKSDSSDNGAVQKSHSSSSVPCGVTAVSEINHQRPSIVVGGSGQLGDTQPELLSTLYSEKQTSGLDDDKMERLSRAINETQIIDKVMPCGVMQRFKEICGVIYPVVPLTIEKSLFYLDGMPLYGVTAEAMSSDLLSRLAGVNDGECKSPSTQRSDVDKVDELTDTKVRRIIVAVSNFDSVYFLTLDGSNQY